MIYIKLSYYIGNHVKPAFLYKYYDFHIMHIILKSENYFTFLYPAFLICFLVYFTYAFLPETLIVFLHPLNAFLETFTFWLTVILLSFLQPANADAPIFLTFLPSLIDLSEVQFLNVEPATLFTTLLYVNLESFLQPLNADDPTDLILFESLKLFKLLQPLNVSEAIEVTLLLYVTFVSFVQPLNAASPTFVTALPSFTVLIDVFFANALSSTAVTS